MELLLRTDFYIFLFMWLFGNKTGSKCLLTFYETNYLISQLLGGFHFFFLRI